MRQLSIAALFCAALATSLAAFAQSGGPNTATNSADQSVITGRPNNPSDAWTVAAGGRIYDNWWVALGKAKPQGTHPAYPASGEIKGESSFRCKECHGWDYRGSNGEYATGKHATGIKGIRAAEGRAPQAILAMLRAAPHGYTPEMMSDEELLRVARFVSRGQHDTTRIIGSKTSAIRGNATRGSAIFQTTCAVCHGYDGRHLNWGTKEEPEFVGTAVELSAAEVLHKIRNGHPGAAMINLRAFPLKDAADLLAYAKTLPTK